MDYRLVFRHLGSVAFLIGLAMCICLPWGLVGHFERRGVFGLSLSILLCIVVGVILRKIGRKSSGELFQKEAIAVVVLSWLLVSVLGALPYILSDTYRTPDIRMSWGDALFESTSAYTTTGATVFGELENPETLPRCVLFWRCLGHFLGGLGILVLLVALAGHGSTRKTIVRAEMSGIIAEKPSGRIRRVVWILFSIYVSMTFLLTVILCVLGVPLFDSLCHAFGTIATGGYSTYNASVGHFAAETNLNAAAIEWAITLFMILSGTNFLLFYWLVQGRPNVLFKNQELRAFLAIFLIACTVLLVSGWVYSDFDVFGTSDKPAVQGERTSDVAPVGLSVRYVFFNTASILTNTGYCTDEYDKWNGLSRFVLLMLFFVGGCAGSTSGSIKVIRHIVCWKMIRRGTELTFRPSLVRPLIANGREWSPEEQSRVLLYFVVYVSVFVFATILILAIEPTSKWVAGGFDPENKAIDVASSVATTLSNTGPGFGIVGARQNFGVYSEVSKYVFCFVMLLGRLEIFAIFALLMPAFWRRSPA